MVQTVGFNPPGPDLSDPSIQRRLFSSPPANSPNVQPDTAVNIEFLDVNDPDLSASAYSAMAIQSMLTGTGQLVKHTSADVVNSLMGTCDVPTLECYPYKLKNGTSTAYETNSSESAGLYFGLCRCYVCAWCGHQSVCRAVRGTIKNKQPCFISCRGTIFEFVWVTLKCWHITCTHQRVDHVSTGILNTLVADQKKNKAATIPGFMSQLKRLSPEIILPTDQKRHVLRSTVSTAVNEIGKEYKTANFPVFASQLIIALLLQAQNPQKIINQIHRFRAADDNELQTVHSASVTTVHSVKQLPTKSISVSHLHNCQAIAYSWLHLRNGYSWLHSSSTTPAS